MFDTAREIFELNKCVNTKWNRKQNLFNNKWQRLLLISKFVSKWQQTSHIPIAAYDKRHFLQLSQIKMYLNFWGKFKQKIAKPLNIYLFKCNIETLNLLKASGFNQTKLSF